MLKYLIRRDAAFAWRPVAGKTIVVALLFVVAGGFAEICHAQSKPVVLITPDEAGRPRQPASNLSFRAGISRGPAITLSMPEALPPAAVQSPIHLQLKFTVHGNAQIDQDSFKLIDVVVPALDLTDRVRSFLKPDGLDVPEAELPPGIYTIRAEIKDKEGRSGSLTFTFNVAKP